MQLQETGFAAKDVENAGSGIEALKKITNSRFENLLNNPANG